MDAEDRNPKGFLFFFDIVYNIGVKRTVNSSTNLNFLLLMIKENDTILTLGMRFSQG